MEKLLDVHCSDPTSCAGAKMPTYAHNEYIPIEDCTILELAVRDRQGVYRFFIDNDVVELVKEYSWYVDRASGRVFTIQKGKKIYLNKVIVEAKHVGAIRRIYMTNPLDYRFKSMVVAEYNRADVDFNTTIKAKDMKDL